MVFLGIRVWLDHKDPLDFLDIPVLKLVLVIQGPQDFLELMDRLESLGTLEEWVIQDIPE